MRVKSNVFENRFPNVTALILDNLFFVYNLLTNLSV